MAYGIQPKPIGRLSSNKYDYFGDIIQDKITPETNEKSEIEESMPPLRQIEFKGEETKTIIKLDEPHDDIPSHFDSITVVPGRDGGLVHKSRIDGKGEWWYRPKDEENEE
jgi:hypothetical protein